MIIKQVLVNNQSKRVLRETHWSKVYIVNDFLMEVLLDFIIVTNNLSPYNNKFEKDLCSEKDF